MSVTWDTSHLEMSALNDVAKANIFIMSVTRDTSHFEMSTLKDVAAYNILLMSVTCDTSQSEMSALKELTPKNIERMSVTCDTSHSPIAPCGQLLFSKHPTISFLSCNRDRGLNAPLDGQRLKPACRKNGFRLAISVVNAGSALALVNVVVGAAVLAVVDVVD